MPKQDIPEDADPVFKEVMNAIRSGNNPDHKRISRLSASQRDVARKALEANKRRRKQRPRTGNGYDDVIDTGMFD